LTPTTLTSSQAAKPLELIVFGGGLNWPIWIAQERGFFARNNVSVNLTQTPNSVFMVQNLVAGKFDIAMGAIDNLVAYMEGQGEAPLPAEPDLVAVMGNQSGTLKVVALPEIRSYADLKGRTISVDALTTGFAFVLRKMLELGGLREGDYVLERVGGTPFRVQALLERKHDCSIVNSPLELPLLARGYTQLGNAVDAIGSYQGTVCFVQRAWARQNEDRLVGLIRGWVAAVDWLYDPANREAALQSFMKNMKADRAGAEAGYRLLLGEREGIQRRARLDIDGIRKVLELRSQYGEPKKTLTDPAKYVDESYYVKALS
jgi:ABC-type nitrate/sulfonate/bicarbonate transport system substrate-binding protein